jgi:hypothetical protein
LIKDLQCSVRLFITSRPVLDPDDSLLDVIRIDIAAHEADVQAYLESVLDADTGMQRFATRDGSLRADIVKKYLAKADGM